MRKLIGILAISLAAPVAAQDAYIGGTIGQSKYDIVDGWPKEDDTGLAVKGFLGYQVNEFAFAELSLGSLGEFSAHWPGYADRAEADIANFTGAVGIMVPSQVISPYVKLGLTSWHESATGAVELVDGTVIYGTGSDSGIAPMYGIGAQLVAGNLRLRFEFERHTDVGDGMKVDFGPYGSFEATGEDVDVISVGVAYAI